MNDFILKQYSMVMANTREEEGQGTLEYIGMIFVVAIVIGAIVTGLNGGSQISDAIGNAIEEVITAAGG